MITAYHGSTRRFDKFSLEHHGTGDGRQIGGYGIYFSAVPEVAMEYALKGGALYTVEIVEHGMEWLDLDEIIRKESLWPLKGAMYRDGFREEYLRDLDEDFCDWDEDPATGQQLYDWLAVVAGSPQNASRLLYRADWLGNTFYDRGTMIQVAMRSNLAHLLREDGAARNYVVFDPEVIVIKDITEIN